MSGIDYGMGRTNIDRSNGIRYGVINMNALAHWAWDDVESDYGEPTCPECLSPVCPSAGRKDYSCESCEKEYWSDAVYSDEPIGHSIDDGELKVTIGTDGDAFVILSPYFTRAAFCSPCAPGACHLESPTDDGERCYCFPHEWFDGGEAPYPVYRVDTGERVLPETK